MAETLVPSLALAEDLRRAIGAFVRHVRAEGDTPRSAQTETLDLLGREGPLSIAALAARRKVKHQSMRLVVSQLEAEGLVDRIVHPRDKRAWNVALTKAGAAWISASRRTRASAIARMIAPLSAADREILRTVTAILDRLAAGDQEPPPHQHDLGFR
ncbi:MarR family winged helix-turn-helix transcriptional regulator [Caulobacter sp.]|uniref:MarR family winged helix-turn-helix transcriptional regulator n=1 Tax=Caulobacter sp. TaxID=78 RepID=UPI002B4A942B|nr:MarR family transcriptional regulator [Caulobacter sp.]HJV40097.1 MarR family transcriptional regulator [Caulobacter sp.]